MFKIRDRRIKTNNHSKNYRLAYVLKLKKYGIILI